MKNFKILTFFLIFVLILSLSLQGCSPKDTDREENPEDIIVGNEEENNAEKNHEENDNKKNDEDNVEDSNQEDIISGDNKETENPDEEISQEESEDTNSNEETLEENNNKDKLNQKESSDNNKDEEVSKDSDQGKVENTINPDENSEENIEKSEDSEEENTESENNIDEKTEKNLLKIQGNVTNELALSLDDLKSMKDLIFSGNYYSLNSFGTTEHTEFTGVNLWSLLYEKAEISPEATLISIIAVDGYQMDFEVEQIKKQDYIDETNPEVTFPIIIAWEENGEEYDPEEGPPYKLVVGQTEAGDVNKPQWVSVIDKIIVE